MSSVRIGFPPWVDLAATVRGAKDPVMVGPTELRWVTRTPDGPGTLELLRVADAVVEAEAFGPGSDWLIAQTPALLGQRDSLDGFSAPEGRMGDSWRARPFLLGRTDRLWDAVVGGILGQKVQVQNARLARRLLARRFGEPAPGDGGGWVLPSPERTAELGYADFHELGVERKRAEILRRAAREMSRFPDTRTAAPQVIEARLAKLRGIGPWTIAMVTATALGNADAVPVGDYHLPNTIAWHLAGEERASDERMLELLEPWAGHRWRVVRLAKSLGSAPKRGPRLALNGDGLHQEGFAGRRRRRRRSR